ncbi:type VII secretion target [Saccharopolyspora tripterygii]
MSKFKVLPDELTAHAGKLDEIAGKIGQIVGDVPALGGEVYGVLGQFFAESAGQESQNAATTIKAVSDSGSNLAGAVRDCAADYGDTDSANADKIGKVGV